MKETMTIHKALSELKTMEARISAAIVDCNVVVANKHSNAKISGISVQDYCARAKSKYQSAKTLIERRNAIKRAVTRSNAVTEVSIGGKTYTVAEAIDMKSKGCDYLKDLANSLQSQYNKARLVADHENGDRLDTRADEYIKSMYGGADLKNMADEINKMRETFIAAQTVELVDPINASREAEFLREEIDKFLSDVDSALSVSNALTSIEVEYETK